MPSIADKFGRRYELLVQVDKAGTLLSVALPFTIEFDIIRNTLTSANVCQIRVYNLSLKNRNAIRYNLSDYGEYRAVQLKAGYGENMPVIFQGNISQAWSVREGVNFITQIECYDGGFAFLNGYANTSFTAGTTGRQKIQGLIATLPGVKPGVIGSGYDGPLARGNSYSGSSVDLLTTETGGGFFVDNEKGNVLATDEYIAGTQGVAQITAASGLIGTPLLERTIVHFDMVFEPSLTVAQKINLNTFTEANFNGDYKVTAVKHRGMISDAVCGSVITTGEFFYTKLLTGASSF